MSVNYINVRSIRQPIYTIGFMLIGLIILASSCNQQSRGFALPAGDIERGKIIYQELACDDCHSISGISWKGYDESLKIGLGGEVTWLKTYGELVTSVINPSHRIAKSYEQANSDIDGISEMRNYNYVMTVQELIDIVTFLQSEYKVVPPNTEYTPYYQ